MGLGPQKRSLADGLAPLMPCFHGFLLLCLWMVFLPLSSLSSLLSSKSLPCDPTSCNFPRLVQIPPARGLASVGVGVLGARDPAPEAVTILYVARPPPLENGPLKTLPCRPSK